MYTVHLYSTGVTYQWSMFFFLPVKKLSTTVTYSWVKTRVSIAKPDHFQSSTPQTGLWEVLRLDNCTIHMYMYFLSTKNVMCGKNDPYMYTEHYAGNIHVQCTISESQ